MAAAGDITGPEHWTLGAFQETRQHRGSGAAQDVLRNRWAHVRGQAAPDGKDLVWIVAKKWPSLP